MGKILFALAAFVLNEGHARALLEASKDSSQIPKPWENPEAFNTFLNSMRPRLRAWCAELSITDGWFVPFAAFFVAVQNWQTASGGQEALFASLARLVQEALGARLGIPEKAFNMAVDSWNPVIETRKEFVARAKNATETAIQAYCDERESEAQAAGLTKTPEKRSRFEPYFWLAGFQTRRWSAMQIADARYHERTAVEKQIRKTAEEVGLTLRPHESYDPNPVEVIRESLRVVDDLESSNLPIEHLPGILARILPPGIRVLLG